MPRMNDLVKYELEGRIATIAMDDGKANALSIDMLNELLAALDQAEQDEAVVVLTGREGRFSAGFDLKVFTEQPERIVEMLRLGADFSERVLGFPTPVVVAANGHAIAAGSFALMAADVRIGTEGPFKVGLNEVQIGLTVPLFVIALARHRLHPAHFSGAVVNATMYSPEDAVAAGYLDRVVPAGDLRTASLEAAEALAALNADAHKATKLRVRGDALKELREGIDSEFPA